MMFIAQAVLLPSALENVVFAHLELAVLLWVPFVWLFYNILPWAYGPEAAEPWSGRRRLYLLLRGVGITHGAFLTFFLFDAVKFSSNNFWRFDPAQFVQAYTESDLVKNDFQTRVLEFALFELSIVLFLVMGGKLHSKWLRGRLSEAERAAGPRGFRAWLSGPNLAWAAAMTLLVSLAFGMFAGHGHDGQFSDVALRVGVLTAMLTLGILTAYPMVKTFGQPEVAVASTPEYATPFDSAGADLSSERQRVLRLLEDGRVTADEASELLSALAATVSPSVAAGAPLSRSRKLAMAGAFVVLIGFFLPWFRLNPIDEARKVFNLPMNSASAMPYVPNNTVWTEFSPRLQIAGSPVTAMPALQGSLITITGGDVGRGFGWLVLAGALLCAAAPAIAGLSIAGQRNLAWLAAGVTSIVMLHLLISSFSWASYGLLFVLLGLGLQWAGVLSELPKRPMPQPAL